MAGDSFLHLTMHVGTETAVPVPSVSGSGVIAEAGDVGLFEGIQDVLIDTRGGAAVSGVHDDGAGTDHHRRPPGRVSATARG
jgi:hypothetical protein